MALTKELAKNIAKQWINKKENSKGGYFTSYYLVVGHNEADNTFYAEHPNPLCPNDMESDKIELKQGEYLMKAYHANEKEPIVLRSPSSM